LSDVAIDREQSGSHGGAKQNGRSAEIGRDKRVNQSFGPLAKIHSRRGGPRNIERNLDRSAQGGARRLLLPHAIQVLMESRNVFVG
jgi:hypothetical protein